MRATLILGLFLTLPASPVFSQSTWFVDDDNCPGPGTGSFFDPFCDVQLAITAALNGDTVLVLPGLYGPIDFLGKAIQVRSDQDGDPSTLDPNPTVTILDGSFQGSVVLFQNGESNSTVLEGFGVINGAQSGNGGGIACLASSPSIIGNILENNTAGGGGGAIYCESCEEGVSLIRNVIRSNFAGVGGGVHCEGGNLQVMDTTFELNVASNPLFGGLGGGLSFWANAVVDVSGSTFAGNDSGAHGGAIYAYEGFFEIKESHFTGNVSGGNGGAIYALDEGIIQGNTFFRNTSTHNGGAVYSELLWLDATRMVIKDNRFIENTAESGDGGGLYCSKRFEIERNVVLRNESRAGSRPPSKGGGIVALKGAGPSTLADNIIADNCADDQGGGIYFGGLGGIAFSRNTVVGNSVRGSTSDDSGGGLYIVSNDTVVLESCIIRGNESTSGGAQIGSYIMSQLEVAYSNIEGGQQDLDLGDGSTLDWGPGMIDVDPLFGDPLNDDFTLQLGSPSVDTGRPSSVSFCELDVALNPRLIDGLLDSAAIVDMGAHEFNNVVLSLTGDASPGGTLTFETRGTPGLSVVLWIGAVKGMTPSPPFGCFGFDFAQPRWFVSWGAIPSDISVSIPSDIPPPVFVVLQHMAVSRSLSAGNLSRPVDLVID